MFKSWQFCRTHIPFLTTEKLPTPEQGIITGVRNELSEILPIAIKLSQNYPNPFNPATKIEFSLPKRSETSLIIYNVLGQEVKRLLDGDLAAGDYELFWDASRYSSGVYLYELRTEKYRFVRKMLLVK
ncbi:T9SS type A sorting domain-containing protein [Candidatus Marinimicrobia bacterium MT.SAG.2]|nr:T9SS type A sorting domain-containing protein [Candidatus Marinimicrobia bacterium MT.SAG.2]